MTLPPATTALYTASEVEARTGVPATTLRQWERRYGFPSPSRTAGGYRMYSPFDIACIAFIQARQDEGVSVSRAVELARAHFAPPLPADLQLSDRLVQALISFDHEGAARVLSEAHLTFSSEDVMMKVMQPTLTSIGLLWERGEITVAHEHQASAYLKARLAQMLEAAGMNEVGPVIVAACGPGEYHEIGLMMLTVVLRRRGIRVHYLGSDTPLADIATFAGITGARAVLISVNSPDSLAQFQAESSALRGLSVPLFLGGQMLNIRPSLAQELGAESLGTSATAAADVLVQRLVNGSTTSKVPSGQSRQDGV